MLSDICVCLHASKFPLFLAEFNRNTRVIQKVSSDGLLKKKEEYITNQFILPFDVHTIHYFSI